jgi:hypothetical protein
MCLGVLWLVSYLFENLAGVTHCDTWILLDICDRSLIKFPIFTYVMFVNLMPDFGVIVLTVPVIFHVMGHFLSVIGDDDDDDDDSDSDSDYNNSVNL